MAHKSRLTKPRKGSRYVVAMVLGTALSSIGAAPALATTASQPEARAINDISRYCTACWRNARLDPDSWNDCTQEVFCRLLERLAPDAWGRLLKTDGDERREFIRAIDAVKKRTQRSRRFKPLAEDAVADRHDAYRRQMADERANFEHAAAGLLSPRQRRILQMSADGWSVHDIATQLHLSPERVSDEKYKGICKLREHFEMETASA
ncbi:MAG TPA: sigma-70 family RNA polymerase sigma factor [Gemmataceae bacterium]|nr:sigma-70 family RNA polymerase sigma factor [Gemmataceae bacterium]